MEEPLCAVVVGKGTGGALSNTARPGLHIPQRLVGEIWPQLAQCCFVAGTRGFAFRVQQDTEKPGKPHVFRAYADAKVDGLEYTLTGACEIGSRRRRCPPPAAAWRLRRASPPSISVRSHAPRPCFAAAKLLMNLGARPGDVLSLAPSSVEGPGEDLLLLDSYLIGVWQLYAKVLVELNQQKAALRALQLSRRMHIPDIEVYPLLAQLAYLRRDWRGVRKYMARLPDTGKLPYRLRGVASFWRERATQGIDIHV